MEATDFIRAFRSLSTNETRQAALEALIAELSPYEWRSLCSLTNHRSFQFDIIGNLPVELVANVFEHLDVCEVFRLQRISHRWRHVLQSPDILKSSLSTWYHGYAEMQHADYAECTRRAQRIQAFRCGRVKNSYKLSVAGRGPQASFLTGNLYLWLHRKSPQGPLRPRSVYVLDLHNWKLLTLSGDAREEIFKFAASHQIVASATFGNICYVWNLQTSERRQFTVPNLGYFASMACRDSTVVCARPAEDHLDVYIWEYESGCGRDIHIVYASGFPYQPQKPGCGHKHEVVLLPQPETKTFIVFADTRCSRNVLLGQDHCEGFAYAQFTYEGKCIRTSETSTFPTTRIRFATENTTFFPVGPPGVFRILLCTKIVPSESWAFRTLQFDEDTFCFTGLKCLPCPIHEDGLGLQNQTAWWNDTFYTRLNQPLAEEEGGVLALLNRDTEGQGYRVVVKDEWLQQGPSFGFHGIVLSEKYIVRHTTDDIYICCFEESEHRPGASGYVFQNLGYLLLLDDDSD